ncbi:MAG: MBL fold metallo-hydrolase [Corallococcus sp.]|nr:MBL fold metallo-hydrolase [Corallococcus sp.]
MKIQYLGHSAFRLISEMGTSVVCDPYSPQLVGYGMPRVSADVVTVSHRHSDHDYEEGVGGDPSVIDVPVALAADDVAIEAIECFHDDCQGAKRGKNIVFVFSIDGIRVAHLGDIGEKNVEVAAKLIGCDVLLVPVGGNYTIDCNTAKWYVGIAKPSIVIPMHYAQGGTIDIDGAEKFTELFDKSQTEYVGDTLVIDDIPENYFKVKVMTRLSADF